MIALARVQRRYNWKLPGIDCLHFEERLEELDVFSLEQRRLRGCGDLIEVYRIMGGLDRVNGEKLSSYWRHHTKGPWAKLVE